MHPAANQASWVTKIVIIDDDSISGVYLETLLKQEGFTPFRATEGAVGRELVRQEQPDLVLLDIQMPGESGLDTCRKLKLDPATAAVPVIFLTGNEDLTTKLDGFKAGAVDYITKPYQTAEVLARIQVQIQTRRMMTLLASTQMAQLDRLARAQQAILQEPALLPEAKFAVFYRPVYAAGGDFYEVLQVGEQIFDYVVADVSGHDADASLVTAALKVLLHQGRSTLSTPRDTLRMVNSALLSAFPEHIYLTLAWVRLNRRRKTLTTFLAGHPPVLHLGPPPKETACLDVPGDVLGIFDTIEIAEIQRTVNRGDRILLFTDGLIELPDAEEKVSRKRGLQLLRSSAEARFTEPLEAMVENLVADLVQPGQTITDDILLLGLEV